MKTMRLILMLCAALSLVAPPTAWADVECNTYTFRYLGYYQDCDCWACGGWNWDNCTECVDPESGGSCFSNGSNRCDPPRPQQP